MTKITLSRAGDIDSKIQCKAIDTREVLTMKENIKAFAHVVSTFVCILSLLALLYFCSTAYALPVERMCRVYVFQLRWVALLFSVMLILIFTIDDAIWGHVWGKNAPQEKISQADPSQGNIAAYFRKVFTPYEADDDLPTLTEQRTYKKAKLKSALLLLPASMALTGITLYAVSELGRMSICLDTYLILSAVITLVLFLYMMFRRDILCGELNQTLSTRKKMHIRCAVTALCVGAALLFVPKAADRIATYNMYWEGSPKTPFTFEYKVNENCTLPVENVDGFRENYFVEQFDLLPRKVLSKFVEDGWTIRIDSNYLAEYSWRTNGKRYGPLFYAITDYPSKTVITHSYNPAIHEIGRYCYSEFANAETVNRLFTAEAEKLRADSVGEDLSKVFSFETAEDFYASCFMEYVMTQDNEKAIDHLAQVIPLTYAYLSTEVFDENVELPVDR